MFRRKIYIQQCNTHSLYTISIEQPSCAAVKCDNFAWHIEKNLQIYLALLFVKFFVKGPIIISDRQWHYIEVQLSGSKLIWKFLNWDALLTHFKQNISVVKKADGLEKEY